MNEQDPRDPIAALLEQSPEAEGRVHRVWRKVDRSVHGEHELDECGELVLPMRRRSWVGASAHRG